MYDKFLCFERELGLSPDFGKCDLSFLGEPTQSQRTTKLTYLINVQNYGPE